MSEKKKRSINSLKLFQDLIINKDEEASSEESLQKSEIIKKREMVTYKKLQNLDIATYDYIFLDRQFCQKTIQDFASFKELLEEIKQKYKPELLNNKNIKSIISEGKFCFNKYNITKLMLFNEKKIKNLEISLNSKYINTSDMKYKYCHFYTTKTFFRGKHCFEIEILQMEDFEITFGILNINYIDVFKRVFGKSKNNEFGQKINFALMNNFEYFQLKSPIFMKKINNVYHHYLSYGDIIGLCYDLDKKLLYLFLNGEIINIYVLNISIDTNNSFVPVISLGKFKEIIFNPGPNLQFQKNYERMGFIPLDENGENNYEKSQLVNVTNQYIDILINNGKTLINNKNITYSDINQIYNYIFDFLGNVSFQHSYIIQNCFIKNMPFMNDNNINDELEFYYICIRYILNSVKDQKALLNNIIKNLIESIHIGLITGQSSFKKLYLLLSHLFSKKDIISIISKFNSKTIRNIFSQIFIHFHPFENLLQKINLDFNISTNPNVILEKNNSINNNNDFIFKDIVTNSSEFSKNIFLGQGEYYRQNIQPIFSKFVEIILRSGIESEDNKNESDNILMKHFKDYFKSIKERICSSYASKGEKELNNILKSFFIPGMLLFNNSYKREENNLISFSIKNYLNEDKYEKLGGTMKFITENHVKEIKNFEEISKMKINSVNNVFILLFLDSFFCADESTIFWTIFNQMISKFEDFSKAKFITSVQKNSYESIHKKFIKLIEYNLCFLNLEEIEIFVKFLQNFVDFINNELYMKKLIYFLPEKIFYRFKYIIQFLKTVIKSSANEILFDENTNSNDNHIFDIMIYLKEREKCLKTLCNQCLKQYISILVKIISDKNIKKLEFKSEILSTLQSSIIEEQYFTDEEIYNIFNFLNEIHNDIEYKKSVNDFLKIFENKIVHRENNFTNLGKRLNKLLELKENNNLLRTILILLYSNMNSSLSKLEEIFAEYKFKPRSNSNNNIINNININDNDNNDDNDNDINEGINIINNLNNFLFGVGVINPFMPGNRVIIVRNRNIRRNIQQLSDKEKLDLLNNYMKETYLQFVKLINFYKLTSNVVELYDFSSFENKYLNNLLISLYNIVFSSTNSNKINDNNVINSYKKLTEIILKLYSTIFNNISSLNKENIIKELAKRRNLYHLKEIGEFFDKQFEQKKDEKKNNNDKTKFFNDFIMNLEKLVPEEETTKLINIKASPGNSELKIDEKNLCQICADSVIDTHIIPCDHSICRNCLFQCLSGNKSCPFCRVQIQGIKEDKNFKI